MRLLPFLVSAAVLLSAASAQDPFVDLGVGNAPIFGNDDGPSPFKTTYACAWVQYVVLASELQAAGIPAGSRLDSTAIIVDAVSGQTWSNVGLNIAHTDETDFFEVTPTGGGDPYYVADFNVQPLRDAQPWTDALGWNVFNSTRNFYWNGFQNIVIEFISSGGTAQYPGGAAFPAAPVGPTIRATDYGNPSTATTRWGTHEHAFPGESPDQCFWGGIGTNKRLDMRLTFTGRPLNDYCSLPYFLPEGNWGASLAGGTTTAGLPGAPPFEQEVWYHYVNQTNVTRTVDVSTCLGGTFDPVIAVFTGACGALQAVVVDDNGCGNPGGDAKATFTAPPWQNFFIAVGRKTGTPLLGDGYFGLSLWTAAPATTSVIGPGCGYGASAAPALSGTAPVLGSVGTISVTGAPAGAFVALLLGVPAPPTPFLDGGCPLHLDPLHVMILRFGMTDAAGAWSFSEVLPNAASLAGVSVGLQAALFAPFQAPSTATTNGLLLTFGA
jgi:hypothetical protein